MRYGAISGSMGEKFLKSEFFKGIVHVMNCSDKVHCGLGDEIILTSYGG